MTLPAAVAIRPLLTPRDRQAVRDFHDRAADYLLLETGLPPDAARADEFFTAAPPGADAAASARLGLWQGDRLRRAWPRWPSAIPRRVTPISA